MLIQLQILWTLVSMRRQVTVFIVSNHWKTDSLIFSASCLIKDNVLNLLSSLINYLHIFSLARRWVSKDTCQNSHLKTSYSNYLFSLQRTMTFWTNKTPSATARRGGQSLLQHSHFLPKVNLLPGHTKFLKSLSD